MVLVKVWTSEIQGISGDGLVLFWTCLPFLVWELFRLSRWAMCGARMKFNYLCSYIHTFKYSVLRTLYGQLNHSGDHLVCIVDHCQELVDVKTCMLYLSGKAVFHLPLQPHPLSW